MRWKMLSRRIPALFTTQSICPNASTASSMILLAPAKSATLSKFARAIPRAACISATTWFAGLASLPSPFALAPRSLTNTCAPSFAASNAISRPIPRPAPVTTTTLPDRHPCAIIFPQPRHQSKCSISHVYADHVNVAERPFAVRTINWHALLIVLDSTWRAVRACMTTGQTRVLRFAFSGESTHMEYEDITYEHHEGIATITINRPTVRNALRPRTYEELTHAMHRAADEPEIGVVVLTGAGNHAFCAGGDVRDQAARTPANGRKHMRRLFALSSVMRMMDKPIIAKVRGYCVGVGNVPIWGACQLLARYVGERKAREMLYTCRLYSAQEAMDMGLINQVCAAEELDSTVTTLCSEILQKSPQSIRIAKLALNAGSDSDFYPSFFPNAELLASAYGNEENREGIVAFLEKRSPDFGRFRRR